MVCIFFAHRTTWAPTVSKRPEKRHANICGSVVLSITPSSDWFVSRRCSLTTVLATCLPSGHAFGTGNFAIQFSTKFRIEFSRRIWVHHATRVKYKKDGMLQNTHTQIDDDYTLCRQKRSRNIYQQPNCIHMKYIGETIPIKHQLKRK